jgi:hypothetical protein
MPRNPRKYDVTLDLVKWCTRTKTLIIDGRFQDPIKHDARYGSERTWDVIRRATETLKELEHVELRARDNCIMLSPLIRCFKVAQLNELVIGGLSTIHPVKKSETEVKQYHSNFPLIYSLQPTSSSTSFKS